MAEINYKDIQGIAKTLNEACGTTIKVIGAKKDDIIAAVKEAMDNGLDGIPDSVTQYFNTVMNAPEEKTKFGNTIKDLRANFNKLGVEFDESKSVSDLEKDLLEHLDTLSDKAYDAIDMDVQLWDRDMTKLINAEFEEKNAKAEEKVEGAKPVKGAKPAKGAKATKAKKPSEKGPIGPRPDFKFSEKTNAFQIMSIFDEMFKASKGEGIKLPDLQDACVKAGVKSNNVKGRVTTVIKYATLPEGGEQVSKIDGLIYPKGNEPAKK